MDAFKRAPGLAANRAYCYLGSFTYANKLALVSHIQGSGLLGAIASFEPLQNRDVQMDFHG